MNLYLSQNDSGAN